MDIRTASFAALACLSGAYSGTPATARLRRGPAPEKYPGQRQAFRVGAWAGDGVPSKIGPRERKPCPDCGRRYTALACGPRHQAEQDARRWKKRDRAARTALANAKGTA